VADDGSTGCTADIVRRSPLQADYVPGERGKSAAMAWASRGRETRCLMLLDAESQGLASEHINRTSPPPV